MSSITINTLDFSTQTASFPKSPENLTLKRSIILTSHAHWLILTRTMMASSFSLILFLLILLCFTSYSSAYNDHRSLRSSKHAPRLLGKFSRPHKHCNRNQQYEYETRYFEQQLDHFSFAKHPSFQQKYLISTKHWVGPSLMGPIFFYCGNEGNIEWFADNTGFVWELAARFGAMVIFPEHRYYGESMPYGSREIAYKNASTLSYLTAEQALADYAVLITELKRNLSAQASPVVLFGGSYGGMLAAWMRLKYPHIAIGALAASAPVLQFEDIVPPEIFYDIVSNDFRRESINCFNTIKESWDIIASKGQEKDGLNQLTKTFGFCRKLDSSDDLSNWLDSAYSNLAMANYPYPANFLMPLPGNPIKELCRRIDSCPDGTSILQRVFEGVSVYYNYTGTVDCFDLDDDPHGESGWEWQACTEMVMPFASNNETSMFEASEWNYNDRVEQCKEEFNVKPRPTWITTEFGGHDFKKALKTFGSNIIFSNGLLDPWSGGSVLEDISETVVALVTEKGAHHLDLRASTEEDPDWLVDQRESEIKMIKKWLNDYYRIRRAIFAV